MTLKNNSINQIIVTSWIWIDHSHTEQPIANKQKFDLLQPLRQWLDNIEIRDRYFAHVIAKIIPAQCPFERDVKLFGRVLFHIPPMCKLNPLYEEVVGLRFRALCYLADECREDISQYC
jgi:Mo-dependent nitrogenase C-terminus